jgi:hypothetical protein
MGAARMERESTRHEVEVEVEVVGYFYFYSCVDGCKQAKLSPEVALA